MIPEVAITNILPYMIQASLTAHASKGSRPAWAVLFVDESAVQALIGKGADFLR
jgi:hypothetical protein